MGQQISGEWYGVGNVNRKGTHNSYLSELVLVQKGNRVTGTFNYYFKDFTVSSRITGTYDAKIRTLHLKTLPVLNYKARNIDGADCPMEGSFTLTVSRIESLLRGQFNPISSYRFTCPAINVKFVKRIDTTREMEPAKQALNTPEPVQGVQPPKALPADSIKRKQEAALVTELNKRIFEKSDVISVDSDSLQLYIYDNGEIDGDTISLFQNRKLIALHKLLGAQPFILTIPLDTTINEISMLAENLGTIPPNTAMCIIYAGKQRFELSLSSTFIKNATIRFRKKSGNTGNKPPL